MKRFILIVLLIALVSFSAAAEYNWFDLSVGVNASFKDGAFSSLKDFKGSKFNDWDFGLEIRTKLLFLEFDVSGELGLGDNNALVFEGQVFVGCSEDMFDVMRLGVCIGPQLRYVHQGSKGGLILDEEGVPGISLKEALKKSPFFWRVNLDFFLGPVLKVGASYTIETEFSYVTRDLNRLVPSMEELKNGKISLVFQMKLI